jgi:hypothetical protein
MMKAAVIFAIVLAAGSAVFFVAGELAGEGPVWALNLCATAPSFCNDPEYLIFGAAGLAGIAIFVRLISLVRG